LYFLISPPGFVPTETSPNKDILKTDRSNHKMFYFASRYKQKRSAMAKHIVFNDINDLIGMIREQSQIIQSYEGKIPQIELDIIMSNLRRLYEDFYELNKINLQFKAEVSEENMGDFEFESSEKELVTIIADPMPIREIVVEKKEPEPEKQSEPVQEKVVVEEKPEPEIIPEVIQTAPEKVEHVKPEPVKTSGKKGATADLFADAENVTVADKYKSEKKSFHDKISGANTDKTLADTLLNPIGDLRTGIGVNDRFVFINELFSGSMNDYQVAIEEINNQPDLAHAEQIISELKRVLNWKESSESIGRLLGFVRRRFL